MINEQNKQLEEIIEKENNDLGLWSIKLINFIFVQIYAF